MLKLKFNQLVFVELGVNSLWLFLIIVSFHKLLIIIHKWM